MRIKYSLIILLILVLNSCHQYRINFVNSISQKTPPPFSFLDIDPNNTNSAYIDRMKQYDQIIQSSSIPIFVIKDRDLPTYLILSLQLESVKKLYGLYVVNSIDLSWPKEFIFINRESSPEAILSTYFHEYQHYKCQITQCYCIRKSLFPKNEEIIISALREKHAIENELKTSLEMKDTLLIKRVIKSIGYFVLYNNDCTYKIASLCVVESKYWTKANLFILQQGKKEKVR